MLETNLQVFFQKDILNIVISSLDDLSLLNFMRCNKFLLNFIGHSDIWWNIHMNIWAKSFLFYRELCELILRTNLVPTTMKIRPYYGDVYYWYRYQKFEKYEFDGYLNLYDILHTEKEDLQKFRWIIYSAAPNDDYYNHISKRFQWLINNLENIKEVIEDIENPILKKFILTYDTFNLQNIIINVENDKHSVKLFSRIGYDLKMEFISTDVAFNIYKNEHSAFLIPISIKANNDKISKYGDGNYTRIFIQDRMYNTDLNDCFGIIAKRIGVNIDDLYYLIRKIFHYACENEKLNNDN
jgi:hypothetical protein